MFASRKWLAVFALSFVSCTGSVTFRSSLDYTFDFDDLSSAFAQQNFTYNQKISTVSCPPTGGDAFCQALVSVAGAGSDIELACDSQLRCNPEPYTVVQDLGVRDFEELADSQISVVDRIELLAVELATLANTSNTDLPAFSLRWGSESSSSGTLDATTQPLVSVAAIPASYVGPATVTVDAAGIAALDAFVRGTSPRVRFFVVTAVDLEPGQTVPGGLVTFDVGLIIKASGQIR